MQADAGFIEDVHDAGQSSAYLGSEANALGFTPSQGVGTAVESEIIKADEGEEAESGFYLLDYLLTNEK